MLKTVVDGDSHILLSAEIQEGAAYTKDKQYFKEFGATTAVTLRMMQEWFGSGRIVVVDAWFGSFKMAYAMMDNGLYVVANVKNNTKRFPKEIIKEVLHTRGDVKHMKVQVEGGHTIYASGHCDI